MQCMSKTMEASCSNGMLISLTGLVEGIAVDDNHVAAHSLEDNSKPGESTNLATHKLGLRAPT